MPQSLRLLALSLTATACLLPAACGAEDESTPKKDKSSKSSDQAPDGASGTGQPSGGASSGGQAPSGSGGTENSDEPGVDSGAEDTPAPQAPAGECERQVLDGKYISYVCPEGVAPPADDGTQLPDPAPAPAP